MDGLPNSARDGKKGTHRWKFFRVGGVIQVAFRSGQDIVNLDQLDQKLWVALACPANLLEFDYRTLQLIDTDKDGRIRAPEIIQVTRWVKQVFKDPDDLLKGGDSVLLSAINDSTPIGSALLTAARRVLSNLGKEDSASVTLADLSDTARIFAATKFNGDGIVPAETAPNDALKKAISDILSTRPGVMDRSGKPGVNLQLVDDFFKEANALLEWQAQADQSPTILPLGKETAVAFAALEKVRLKVDDYFARCRIAAFDPRATASLNGTEAEFTALGAHDLSGLQPEVVRLPLARVQAGAALPLQAGVNPAWAVFLDTFRVKTAIPLLGKDPETLSEPDWLALKAKLAPYELWLAAKPRTTVEPLGIARLHELVSGDEKAKLHALIQEDLTYQVASEQIVELEKLVRVQRDLFRLLKNFVSFSDFYARRGAIFQAGTLYLDARSCELCVHVGDTAKHAALAGLARAYLAYCECTRPGGAKRTIAAAFTAGDSDHLMVGRNGIFYDRNGLDWDATITRIIDNPISIRQAFFSPYKKFIRLVEEQVAKRAAAAETAAQGRLGEVATHVASIDIHPPATPAIPGKPAPKRIDVGTVAALGVALGSFATFLGVMFSKFVELRWWAPFALVGVMLAISGPSVLIAWLKLRQRNLGPILDANGWAVNGRMKINVPFGGALSKIAKVPPGSDIQMADPFGETHDTRNIVIILLILLLGTGIAWRFNLLNRFLSPPFQHHTPKTQSLVLTNITVTNIAKTNLIATPPSPVNP